MWAKRGTRPRAPRDQRYEWAYIFGAVCPERSLTAALVLPCANAQAMNLHLEEISKQVAADAHAVLILDRAGYHKKAALDLPHNITLLPLPAYSPELNPAENIWGYLRGNKLANTVYETYDEIVDKACEAWMFFANDKDTRRLNRNPRMGKGQCLGPLVLQLVWIALEVTVSNLALPGVTVSALRLTLLPVCMA